MTRRLRIDFRGALYLVRLNGRRLHEVFYDSMTLGLDRQGQCRAAEDLRHFHKFAAQAFEECAISAHAFSFSSNSAIWVLETLGKPLGYGMRRLVGDYSRYLHPRRRIPKGFSLFPERYEAKLLSPRLLPAAVRRVHRFPVDFAGVDSLDEYPFTSHWQYLDGPGHSEFGGYDQYVVRDDTMRLLERYGFRGREGYQAFIALPESPQINRLFERGAPTDPRIVGDHQFVMRAHQLAKAVPRMPTREQIMATVAKALRISTETLCTARREGALGRAMVAWYATRIDAATLTDVGLWFGVSPRALRVAMRRFRSDQHSRHLFKASLRSLGKSGAKGARGGAQEPPRVEVPEADSGSADPQTSGSRTSGSGAHGRGE